VRYCGTLSSSYEVLSGVPKGSVLGPLLFNTFINDLRGVVKYSDCLLFADDIKLFREINSPHDSFLLQCDTNCVRGLCISNFMKLNVKKTRVISFSRKTKLRHFDYQLCESLITRTECIKDPGVQIDSKLHFHHHVDYIFSQAIRLLGLIRTETFSFSSLQSLLMLYYTSVRPKLEYASVAWNPITSTDASKLQRIQRKFVSLCRRRFFSHLPYSYTNVLNYLKFHTLSDRRCHLDALFYLMFSVVQNFVLLFSKLSAFECRLEISEILNCFMLTLAVATDFC
jgi:hypothetical protein